MVDSSERSDSLRARAVRALAPTRSDAMRDWLIGLATRRTRILRRFVLAEPTQVAVSAMQALLRVHADDAALERVRALVRRRGTDPRWTKGIRGSPAEQTS